MQFIGDVFEVSVAPACNFGMFLTASVYKLIFNENAMNSAFYPWGHTVCRNSRKVKNVCPVCGSEVKGCLYLHIKIKIIRIKTVKLENYI